MHRVRMSVRENRLVSRVLTESDYVAVMEGKGSGWVIEKEGVVVGCAVANGEDGSIWALFVDPQFEHAGFGRRLHDAMTTWLWRQGFERLWLTTEPNTRAARFYAAAGWVQVGPAQQGEVRFELTRGEAT